MKAKAKAKQQGKAPHVSKQGRSVLRVRRSPGGPWEEFIPDPSNPTELFAADFLQAEPVDPEKMTPLQRRMNSGDY